MKLAECFTTVLTNRRPLKLWGPAVDLPDLQYAPRAAPQIFALYCKTRNFVAQFARINRALFQNVNKRKILVLKPSSRLGFERPFKTAANERKKFKKGQCF